MRRRPHFAARQPRTRTRPRPRLPARDRPRSPAATGLARVRRHLRRAPGTFVWLTVLLVTSVIMNHLAPDTLESVLQRRSTNIHNLLHDPGRVLLTSALWLDGGGWPLYFVLYHVFHVPAERWLGTKRWLAVLAIAHIGATYLSEGILALAIRSGAAPHSAVNTLDVGVSYALAGIVGVLTYRIARPWRHGYLLVVSAFYAVPLITGRTFTDVGHFAAMAFGLACYPLTRTRTRPRDRPGTRIPATALHPCPPAPTADGPHAPG